MLTDPTLWIAFATGLVVGAVATLGLVSTLIGPSIEDAEGTRDARHDA